MGKKYSKDRLSEEIKKIISSMLMTDIKDPRLAGKMISITAVDVTSDGSYATCYISVLGTQGSKILEDGTEEAEKGNQEVLEGLKSASGILRSEIGSKIKMRRVPELIFKIDSSMAYGRKIEKMLKELEDK